MFVSYFENKMKIVYIKIINFVYFEHISIRVS